MDPHDTGAMYELQLELHDLAAGRRPRITADEVIEMAAVLARHEGDFQSLMRACPSH